MGLREALRYNVKLLKMLQSIVKVQCRKDLTIHTFYLLCVFRNAGRREEIMIGRRKKRGKPTSSTGATFILWQDSSVS